jgi:2-oxoacid:acceptor oxidoreductase delta subunit (pyruvate/2-ketoisovalerate family)
VRTADLTALALETLGRGSALSAPLAAVSCALVPDIGAGHLEAAVRDELHELALSPEMIDQNVALARQVFEVIVPVPLRHREAIRQRTEMHHPSYAETIGGVPVLLATGNATHRHTGAWRLFRPVIDQHACTRCLICLAYCPDSAITLNSEGYPVIDYDNCKGCLICQHECPIRCIHEEKEVRAW